MIKKIIFSLLFCCGAMAMQHNPYDYRSFLETLTGTNNSNFNVEVKETQIIVHGSKAEISELKDKLAEALSSSTELAKNLHYELIATEEIIETPFPLHTISAAKEFLHKLLKSTIDELALNLDTLFDEQQGALFDDGLISSRPLLPRHQKSYQGHCESLGDCFRGYSDEQIKQAWDENRELLPLDEVRQENSLAKECVYLSKKETDYCLNIDLRSIFERTHCMAYCMQTEQSAMLVIDKVLLFDRVRRLIDGDALLQLVRNEEEKTFALPIILPKKISDARRSLYFFVIDKSGSLRNVIDHLKIKLEKLINYIGEKDPDALAQFVSFNDRTFIDEEVLGITDQRLITKIRTLQAVGSTRLFGTLRDVINHINNNKFHEKYNVTITLFTDGVNEDGGCFCSEDVTRALHNTKCQPHSITFGLGSVDPHLGNFATETGGHYYSIAVLDDLQSLLEQNSILVKKQNFVEVLMKIGEEIVGRGKITQNSSDILMPPLAFEVDDTSKFSIGNQDFNGFDHASVPLASCFEQARIMQAQVYDIANDETKTIKMRVNELNIFKEKVQAHFAGSLVNPARSAALKTIDEYIALLNRRLKDNSPSNFRAALSTLSGIFESFKNLMR